MTVSLVQWRALIGVFNCQISGTSTNNRYNLIRKFVSMLENLLLFYHYVTVYYRNNSSIYFCSFTLPYEDIDPNQTDNVKEDLLLYGDTRFDENKNKIILKATINYIKNTERFSGSLFD